MHMFQKLDQWLAPGPRIAALADPLFRVLTSLIFIIGGLGHFGQHQMMLDRMAESPWAGTVAMIGDPSWLLWLSGGVFVACGITLALGWMTRASALALFVTLVPVTVAIHFAPGHVGPLFKNVAILGALFLLWAKGPGAYALDRSA
jgi:putative oxidoreductase